jgi:hypothetical protein
MKWKKNITTYENKEDIGEEWERKNECRRSEFDDNKKRKKENENFSWKRKIVKERDWKRHV